jgi:hypothetical protein
MDMAMENQLEPESKVLAATKIAGAAGGNYMTSRRSSIEKALAEWQS